MTNRMNRSSAPRYSGIKSVRPLRAQETESTLTEHRIQQGTTDDQILTANYECQLLLPE